MLERRGRGPIRKLVATMTAGDDGAFPAMALPAFDGILLSVRTAPGNPAPSDGFSVRLCHRGGYDALEGAGERRPACTCANLIRYHGLDIHPYVARRGGPLTLCVHGTVVPGARVTVEIVYGVGAELDTLNLLGDHPRV